jgi:hypothetical protein
MTDKKVIAAGDLIQVNEDGPENWFRCILVVNRVESWGVGAYCTTPSGRGRPSCDAFTRLDWAEFDKLCVKSKFVATEMPQTTL